jgi:type I restriction enzyme S subunit
VKNGWSEVALGKLLEPVSRSVRVEPDTSYRLLGVRLEGNGAFHRETKLGNEISASILNRVETGDFIYSRLFACRGAFSLIGPELGGAFVSNEFPIFAARNPIRINLRFLSYWFRRSQIWKVVEDDCQGSTPLTRNRYKEEFFNALHVPLPPIPEQQRIVAHLDTIEARLARVQKLREEQELELQAALRSAFRRLEAGAAWVEMGDIAPVHRRPIEISLEGEYPELGARSFGRGIFHKPTLRGDSLTWQKLFQMKAGDIVISNIKAWEGAIAVASESDDGRYGSHRYLTCLADLQRALPEFICFYLLSPSGLEQVGLASPGSADRNRTLAVDRLERIKVPVVPVAAQREFKKLLDLRAKLRAEAAQARQYASALLPSLLDSIFNPSSRTSLAESHE